MSSGSVATVWLTGLPGAGKTTLAQALIARGHSCCVLDFIDHLVDFDRFGRADQLFAKDKAIGAPLSSILAVQDLPQSVKDRIFFVKFEDLVAHLHGVQGVEGSNPFTPTSRQFKDL